MVYTDERHIIADTLTELHTFCKSIGIKSVWFENKTDKGHPHYDVPIHKRNIIRSLIIDKKIQWKTSKEIVVLVKILAEKLKSRGVGT